jgi:hypothetical protein
MDCSLSYGDSRYPHVRARIWFAVVTVRDKKSLALRLRCDSRPDLSAIVLSVETRAEGCSEVEFRRISLQAVDRLGKRNTARIGFSSC